MKQLKWALESLAWLLFYGKTRASWCFTDVVIIKMPTTFSQCQVLELNSKNLHIEQKKNKDGFDTNLPGFSKCWTRWRETSSDRNLISHFLLQKSLKCQNICVLENCNYHIFTNFCCHTMQPELSIRSCKKYNYLYSTNLKSGLLLTPFCWKKKLQFFSCGFEVFTAAVLLLALFAKETFWCCYC